MTKEKISVLLDKAEEHGLNIELDEAILFFSEKEIEEMGQ